MILFPMIIAGLVVLLLRQAARDNEAWARDPARPWNITAKLQREHIEWERSRYGASHSMSHHVTPT